MNQAILLLQKLCQVMVVFLVGMLFFATVGFGWQGAAIAKPLTPEARSYESPSPSTKTVDQQVPDTDVDLIENTRDKLRDAADNVREKLNLDEPIAPSTKKFVRSVEDAVDGDGMSREAAQDYHY